MGTKIVPTLFSKSRDDLYLQYNKLSSYFSYFHIDITSTDFVGFDFYDTHIFKMLEENNHFCEVHLMCKNVEHYITEIITFSCVKSIIVHFEIFESIDDIGDFKNKVISKYPSVSFQLAISPQTLVEDVFMYLSYFKHIMVMGVMPGSQGQEFISLQLKKAQIISKLGLSVSIDGGINAKTLNLLLSTQKIHQLNIGSYLNLTTNKNQLENNILIINSLLAKYESASVNKNPPIVIADIGGTHVKVYRGLYNEFSIEHIEHKKTNSFSSSKEILKFAVEPLNPKNIILGVAGAKEIEKISMTHDTIEFKLNEIQALFPKSKVQLFNDCELAGYGIYSQNKSNFKKLNDSYLEVLIIMGTGLGITHISNSNVVYNSQGGHIYPKIDDLKYLHYLEEELNTSKITFDDILSANGLENRFMFDTTTYKNSYEIINLAKKRDPLVIKTITFFLQEFLYFLQDCIYFDNITTKMYLGGEFVEELYKLLKFYFPKELQELEMRCEVEIISKNFLQFLGGLELIRRETQSINS